MTMEVFLFSRHTLNLVDGLYHIGGGGAVGGLHDIIRDIRRTIMVRVYIVWCLWQID